MRLFQAEIESIKKRANAADGINYIKEVNRLIGHIEYIQAQLDAALADISKHGQTIRELQSKMEQAPQPVVIPKEVAKAIEYFRSSNLKFSNGAFARIFFQNIEIGDHEYTITLKKYVDSNKNGKGDTLLAALVNDYTVEQPEPSLYDRIHEGVQKLYQEWLEGPISSGDTPKCRKQLAASIADFVTKEFEKDSKNGG